MVNELSRKSKFVQRKSKLDALAFLKFCTFGDDGLCEESLSKLCSSLRKQERISISTEGLNLRFNKNGVAFLRSFLLELIKKQNEVLESEFDKIKEKFRSIRIMDSTSYELPDNLKGFYRGNGGGASEAAAKLHLEYDLLTGSFVNLEVTQGTKNDGDYMWDIMYSLEKGDLCIRDLGYFSSLAFEKMSSKGVYFISKVKSSTLLYSDNPELLHYCDDSRKYKEGEPFILDIKKIHSPLAEGETIELSNILLGKTHKTPIRLIITKLPEEVKAKRQMKREAMAKKKKSKSSRDSLDAVNVFATNVPPKLLETALVQKIYSLRWQIEIMFKIWKSLFKIHSVNKVKVERFECFVYGKLISLVLGSMLINIRNTEPVKDKTREMSIFKCYDIIRTYLEEIRTSIFSCCRRFLDLVTVILDDFSRYGIKSKRQSKLTCGDILNLI